MAPFRARELGVEPRPPVVAGLPLVGCGPQFLRNPKGFLLEMKARHGDVFLAKVFGWRLFFVFSASALESLYQLPEEEASFTEATRTLIGLKLPPELLSVNNTAFGSLDRFDPAHWERGRIAPSVGLPAQELVSTFGHGRHSCVGERFATAATKIVLARLLERFDFEPAFSSVAIAETQLGAVGRAAHPCIVKYQARGAWRAV